MRKSSGKRWKSVRVLTQQRVWMATSLIVMMGLGTARANAQVGCDPSSSEALLESIESAAKRRRARRVSNQTFRLVNNCELIDQERAESEWSSNACERLARRISRARTQPRALGIAAGLLKAIETNGEIAWGRSEPDINTDATGYFLASEISGAHGSEDWLKAEMALLTAPDVPGIRFVARLVVNGLRGDESQVMVATLPDYRWRESSQFLNDFDYRCRLSHALRAQMPLTRAEVLPQALQSDLPHIRYGAFRHLHARRQRAELRPAIRATLSNASMPLAFRRELSRWAIESRIFTGEELSGVVEAASNDDPPSPADSEATE